VQKFFESVKSSIFCAQSKSDMSNTPASTRVVNKQKRLDSAGNLVANLTGSVNPQLKRLPEVKLMDVGDYKVVDHSSRLVSTCVDSAQ